MDGMMAQVGSEAEGDSFAWTRQAQRPELVLAVVMEAQWGGLRCAPRGELSEDSGWGLRNFFKKL